MHSSNIIGTSYSVQTSHQPLLHICWDYVTDLNPRATARDITLELIQAIGQYS